MRTDPHRLRELQPLDPSVVELREWSRITDDLSKERNRLASKLREQLWRYYPQFLELGADLSADWALDLWRLVPTPADARRIRPYRVTTLLKKHRLRRSYAKSVLATVRQEPVPTAPGVVAAAIAHCDSLERQLGILNEQARTADRRIGSLVSKLKGDR